jgi:death on curing protein
MEGLLFLTWEDLEVIHHDQLQRYGGQEGFVDEQVVRSALARAQFTAQYNADADLADLAAEYLFGLATTQGYLDGNKRTGLAAASVFLRKNGWQMTITDELMYVLAMGVATNTVDKERLARIIRDHAEGVA